METKSKLFQIPLGVMDLNCGKSGDSIDVVERLFKDYVVFDEVTGRVSTM